MTAISLSFVAGRVGSDPDVMSRKIASYIRKRAGHRCAVWVSEQGDVTVAPTSSAPEFSDISPLVGIYLHKPGETFWRDRLRDSLIEQASAMQVTA